MDRIKVGVVGIGYVGKFHAEKYARLPEAQLVGVVDVNKGRAEESADRFHCFPFFDHRELLGKVQAVSIAVPTSLHFSVAKDFIQEGIDVLVEKPITAYLEEAEELVRLANDKGVILQVGHLERFNPTFIALEEILERPMFIECYRMGSFIERAVDMDVVSDLMIHDIDIISTLVKSRIKWIHSVGVPILSSKLDIANARIQFEDGCVANVTASRVSLEKMRKIRIFQQDAYISIDFINQKALVYRRSDSTESPIPGVKIEPINVQRKDPLEEQLKSFLLSVKTRKPPLVTGEDGKRALEVAHKILQQIRDPFEGEPERCRRKLY